MKTECAANSSIDLHEYLLPDQFSKLVKSSYSSFDHFSLAIALSQYYNFKSGLDIYYQQYHSSFYQTHCDSSDNVCLDLHNCRHSIYILIQKQVPLPV